VNPSQVLVNGNFLEKNSTNQFQWVPLIRAPTLTAEPSTDGLPLRCATTPDGTRDELAGFTKIGKIVTGFSGLRKTPNPDLTCARVMPRRAPNDVTFMTKRSVVIPIVTPRLRNVVTFVSCFNCVRYRRLCVNTALARLAKSQLATGV
jgi:hypothetical protein